MDRRQKLVRNVCFEAGAGSLAELRLLIFGLQLSGALGPAQMADSDAHALELLPRCAGLVTALAPVGWPPSSPI